MPWIYDLKPRFQAVLRPRLRSLAASGVSANHGTVAAMVLSLIAGAMIAVFANEKWLLLILPLALFLRPALNAIDGMLARCDSQRAPRRIVGHRLELSCDSLHNSMNERIRGARPKCRRLCGSPNPRSIYI
jgi:CDP-diacylglycerol--glycerol-3-phosphate 3-phosphatidyltransferase